MSKYWLGPHASGRRKGKEKIWAHETPQRTKRRNAVPARTGELDLTIMTTTGPARVAMVPALAVRRRGGSPSGLLGDVVSPLS